MPILVKMDTQTAFTCSKFTIETLEQGVIAGWMNTIAIVKLRIDGCNDFCQIDTLTIKKWIAVVHVTQYPSNKCHCNCSSAK